MNPVTSQWKPPRWSPFRQIRDWFDRRTINKALSRPRPHRDYGNAPFEVPVLTQEKIDAR